MKRKKNPKMKKNPKRIHEQKKIQNRHHLSQTKHPKGPLKHRKPSEQYEKLYGKRESPKIPIHSLKKQEANLNVQYNGLGFRRAIARLLY